MRSEIDGSAIPSVGTLRSGRYSAAEDQVMLGRSGPISDERFQSDLLVGLMGTALKRLGRSRTVGLQRRPGAA